MLVNRLAGRRRYVRIGHKCCFDSYSFEPANNYF